MIGSTDGAPSLALDEVALGIQPDALMLVGRVHPPSYHLPVKRIGDLAQRLTHLGHQAFVVLDVLAAGGAQVP